MAVSATSNTCYVRLLVLCMLLAIFRSVSLSIIQNGHVEKLRLEGTKKEGDSHTKPESGASLDCSLPSDLVDEIASYDWLVQQVSDLVLNGALKGVTYDNLGTFVDKFGPRLTGSTSLEDSIDYLVNFLNESGIENVHTEDAPVPIWTRGNESLYLIEPRFRQLTLLGLGSSIGTPPEGITAEVLVVRDFDELDAKADQVPGKIVVYNEVYIEYGQAVAYRSYGAVHAAKYGAVASLTRSVTPNSIYSPHTGWQDYEAGVPQIPAACITVEDAEMFQRMQDRGDTIVLRLLMEAQNSGMGTSRNTIGERVGATNPEEVVIIGGHVDTWDVGQGAMDDGGGAFISAMVQIILGELNLRPRRTLRTILWTSEEQGYFGSSAYSIAHADELPDFDIVMESDEGTFDPAGLAFSGTTEAACIVQEVVKLTSALLNGTSLVIPDDGSDEMVFTDLGVPTASLNVKGESYFNYHHSNGDMMTVEDPDQVDRCLFFWTVTSYVIADLSIRLPRDNTTTPET